MTTSLSLSSKTRGAGAADDVDIVRAGDVDIVRAGDVDIVRAGPGTREYIKYKFSLGKQTSTHTTNDCATMHKLITVFE